MHVTQIDNRRLRHARAAMRKRVHDIWDVMHNEKPEQRTEKYKVKRAEMLSAISHIKFLQDEQSARLARRLHRTEWKGVKAKPVFESAYGSGTSNGRKFYNWISKAGTFGCDNHLYRNVSIW